MLPDRHGGLDLVDELGTGEEGVPPVGRGDDGGQRHVSDRQLSDAVDDRQPHLGMAGGDIGGDLGDLLGGQLVGLIEQPRHSASSVMIADDSGEADHGSACVREHIGFEGGGRDRCLNDSCGDDAHVCRVQSPLRPPDFSMTLISLITAWLSTALIMSKIVSAAVVTAVRASISTPVFDTVLTAPVMRTESAPSSKSTSMPVSGSGWHSGMRSLVRLAPITAAMRATGRASPLGRPASAIISMTSAPGGGDRAHHHPCRGHRDDLPRLQP